MKQFYLVAMAIACVCLHANAQTKLSLNKPTFDSTALSSSNPSSYAVDNSTATKWISSVSYRQWLYVDLQAVSDIGSVTIAFADGFYATTFDIHFSNDAVNWTLGRTVSGNTSATVNVTGLSGLARYVRFQGRGRANSSGGYNIADFSVYGPTPPDAAQSAELKTIASRLRGRYTQRSFTYNEVTSLYNSINADGSWSDITYTNTGNWPTHAERLRKMALGYNNYRAGNVYYQQDTMRRKIAAGLSYLNRRRPPLSKWFEREIGAPENYATALIIIKDSIPADSARLYSSYLNDDTDNSSHRGMNRAWISSITLHKGIIENNYALAARAVKSMATCLDVVSGYDTEGPRVDGSFHQHHNQLQTGSYGKTFVEYFASYVRITDGLPFGAEFSSTRRATLSNLFLNGLRLMTYRKNVDFGAVGRELSGNLSGTMLISSPMLDSMALNDPANAAAYRNWRDHVNNPDSLLSLSLTKYFWKSSILTRRSPGYYMSAKVPSERGAGTESLNGENIKGFNLPMGATNILRTGGEYYKIFPYWRWSRVPGTTTELSEDSASLVGYMDGTNAFGGGVSQPDGGIIAYEHDYKGVRAKKAYVFLNNHMICMGAGIYGTRPNEVVTSLEQAFSTGAVTYRDSTLGTSTTFAGDSLTTNKLTWIHHNNIGYVIPNGGLITLLNKNQSGRWRDIDTEGSTATISDTIFSAYFRHSANPSNRHYSYIVAPNVPVSSMDSLKANSGYTFPRNEPDIQALRSVGGEYPMYAVVFYEPGTIKMDDSLTITSNQKAIVLIKDYPATFRISVADPLYTQGTITLKLNRQVTGPNASYASGVTTINFSMPTGEMTGSTNNQFYSKVFPAAPALMAAKTTTDEVGVFPNPATNYVELRGYRLSNGTMQIRLADAQGRFIKNITATGSPVRISTTGLPSGKYYLQVNDKTKIRATYPFLIVR